ncbi:hypothetical protein CNMCM8927_000106 [Aspergillus lentulus]|uniref:Methionine aminopeptidase 2 n=1 Tax=Aspergillus lentulus TaxID=293939 RepID=A0AAN6BN95_ASPLE|nr:hypothetical protein CNMCM8927_000106 [Aspergillus lentulus]
MTVDPPELLEKLNISDAGPNGGDIPGSTSAAANGTSKEDDDSDDDVAENTPANRYRTTSEEKRHLDNLNSDFLSDYRQAAEAHRQVRQWAQRNIKPGQTLLEIVNGIEDSARRLVGHDGLREGDSLIAGMGFPTGLNIDNIVAHYSPNAGCKTVLAQNHVLKVDIGIHVGGRIVDSAFTMAFDPMYDNLLAAVKDATNTGVREAGIDVRVGELGGYIQEAMESYECEINGKTHPIKAIRNLCGHTILPYSIHGTKSVPIIKSNDMTKMEEGDVFAIETFGSTGSGDTLKEARSLLTAIKKNFSTIPFCRRYLDRIGQEKYLLAELPGKSGIVDDYPPLNKKQGTYTAQFEHRWGYNTFATVGNLEQRHFPAQELGLRENHTSMSDPTVFPRALRDATGGHGLDVIICQPTNGNLDYENARLLATGGRLIRITNEGVDAGNWLFTGSFAPNCSFQSLGVTALPEETIEYTRLGYESYPRHFDAQLAVPTRPATALAQSILNLVRRYIFVGGLKGICGSLVIHLASHGAKSIAVMSRSGCGDKVSQSIARNIRALGCSLDLLQGDVTSISDVRRACSQISKPIGGVIQVESMSHVDYHAALSSKGTGTSNLHTVSLETKQPMSFFTMLSSISGVIGQKGQANYAGGNALEDTFAEYRRASGLPTISIDLGPIEDVGVIHGNEELQNRFDGSTLLSINEGLLHRIFDFCILQQHADPRHRLNVTSQGEKITSLLVPQSETAICSEMAALGACEFSERIVHVHEGNPAKIERYRASCFWPNSRTPIRAAVWAAAITVVGARLAKQVRLTDVLDSAHPLSYYG